jgi:Divergent InlB B-repeat domain
LTASAAAGSRFSGWSGAGCSGTGTCVVTMSAARSVTADFVAVYTLGVTHNGSGSGTVASDVGGIDCGFGCSANFDDGTVVTLTATAALGSRFTGWSGAGCSGTGTCLVTMSAPRSVTAAFVALYPLTVAKSGSGSGWVSALGIDCGANCAADYDDGTVVTLSPTADPGSVFAGWSGACSGTGSCVVTMTTARLVTAAFAASGPPPPPPAPPCADGTTRAAGAFRPTAASSTGSTGAAGTIAKARLQAPSRRGRTRQRRVDGRRSRVLVGLRPAL